MTEEAAEKIWHGGPEAFQIVRELYADMVRKLDGFEQNAKLLLDACEKVPLVWIPVGDRLPGLDERVMVCHLKDGWVSIGSRQLTGEYHHWDGDDYEELHTPTHWMPLPEPPEVK